MTSKAPAEVLAIAPEAIEIANAYLQTNNINAAAEMCGMSVALASDMLERKEVRSYINRVYFDLGFNNRVKMRRAMDALISRKFKELEESDMGSSKDIADLLALSHKMTMEQLDKELALEKLRAGAGIKNQLNVQINEAGDKYGQLINKLLSGG